MKRNFFVLFPSFEDYGGHEVAFLKPLKFFTKKNNFELFYFLPKINSIKLNNKSLKIFFGSKNNFFLIKIIYILLNYIQIYKNFSKNLKKRDVIYIDGYSFYFLISFVIYFIFFIKNKDIKIIFWLRYPYLNSIKDKLLKYIIWNIFDLKKVIFLTENNKLKKNLKKFLRIKNLCEMPSLHNLKKYKKINKNYDKKKPPVILCPGVYREEKYGKNLINFLTNNYDKKFQLRISQKFREKIKDLKFVKKNSIYFLKENLDQRSHLKELAKSDIIFLPYKMPDYEYRTSGLFFEAISLGKSTLMTKGSLLDDDLKKFNLLCFSIRNWENLTLDKVDKILSNKKNFKNLLKLSNYYNKINGEKYFNKKLNDICKYL